jgi:hypothetical protein
MRPSEYFDRNGFPLTEKEARDRNGIIRDGVTMRVRMQMRDSAQRFTDGRQFWDSNRDSLVVTDAQAVGGAKGCQPGFRILDSAVNRQAREAAYRDYEADLTSAYKNPSRSKPKHTTDAVCPDCDGGGAINGETYPRCEGTGELDEYEDRSASHDRRTLSLDQIRADHQQRMRPIYDEIANALQNAWRAGK